MTYVKKIRYLLLEQTEKLRDNDSVSKHLEAEKNTLTIELTEANKEIENLQDKRNSLLQKHSEELARMKNNNDRLLEENENFSKYLKVSFFIVLFCNLDLCWISKHIITSITFDSYLTRVSSGP